MKRTQNTVTTTTCAYCTEVTPSKKRCSRCNLVHYCSRVCQKQHWSLHKKACHLKASKSAGTSTGGNDPSLRRQIDYYCNLGRVLLWQGDPAGSIAALKSAIILDPKYAPAQLNLGATFQAMGDNAGAVAAFHRAIAIDPHLEQAHHNLGVTLDALGDNAGAIAAYKRAVAIDPNSAPAHCDLGASLGKQGDSAGAAASFKKAIAINPSYEPAHTNLGFALYEEGDYAGAVAALNASNAIMPLDAIAKQCLQDALSQKCFQVARQCLKIPSTVHV